MVGNCGNGGILSNFTAKVRWTLADDYYVARVQAAKLLKPINCATALYSSLESRVALERLYCIDSSTRTRLLDVTLLVL